MIFVGKALFKLKRAFSKDNFNGGRMLIRKDNKMLLVIPLLILIFE
jgi:hypothetical protein